MLFKIVEGFPMFDVDGKPELNNDGSPYVLWRPSHFVVYETEWMARQEAEDILLKDPCADRLHGYVKLEVAEWNGSAPASFRDKGKVNVVSRETLGERRCSCCRQLTSVTE